MIYSIKKIVMTLFSTFPLVGSSAVQEKQDPAIEKKTAIKIILGSTRQGRSSEIIARNLEKIAQSQGIVLEIIDLRVHQLPFLDDPIAPAKRKEITDPEVKKWSEKIKDGDAFILICPEYNGGYPGVLKNALDSLFVEWNNKPVGMVVYSGGPSGGTNVLEQLNQVAERLKMIPITTAIKIPTTWKAFDTNGDFIDTSITQSFERMLNELISALK